MSEDRIMAGTVTGNHSRVPRFGFLSFKWKALALTSLVLIAMVVAFTVRSHLHLLAQFRQTLDIIHTHDRLEVEGLIKQSRHRMQLLAELIPALGGMREALQRANPDALRRAFDPHWSEMQINSGLMLAHFYDRSNRHLNGWSPPERLREHGMGELVAQANRLEKPVSVLDCQIDCFQYVAVPLLVEGRHVGAVLLGGLLTDIVLGFKHISGTEVGLLITGNRAQAPTGERVLASWEARVIALTDAVRTLPLLKEVAEHYAQIERLRDGIRVQFGGRDYEVALIGLGDFSGANRGYLVTVEDITASLATIAAATRDNVLLGLAGLALAEGLMLVMLGTPMKRLRRTAQNLPLLADSEFEHVRSAIDSQTRPRWMCDEVDILDATALDLSHQLEKLERDVSDRTRRLGEQMQALAAERDFVRSLLDTAQVIVITQTPERRILMMNPYGQDIIGLSAAEAVSTDFDRLIARDEHAAEVARTLSGLASGERERYRHESRLLCRDGTLREVVWLHSALGNHGGSGPGILTIGMDVTERKKAESRVTWLADHDPLSGLFNRRRFQQELERALALAGRHGHTGAVLFFDLDQFKYVNDTSGHQAGDMLLKLVSHSLTMMIREEDTVARLGGDEFALLVERTDEAGAIEIARKIITHLASIQMPVGNRRHRVGASIGIALYPQHGETVKELLTTADLAMYQAKESGRGGWHVFSPDDTTRERLHAHVYWKERVEAALSEDHFVLHYQPIRNLQTNAITHYEALLRMREGSSLVPPDSFIGACERAGLIHAIDRVVVAKAIAQAGAFARAGQDVALAINLSAHAFENTELVGLVRDAVRQHDVDPRQLIFEITETAAVANFAAARGMMEAISTLGCRFALDDFGVGFSSLLYLKQLPVDLVKIDGSFIQGLVGNRDDQILVKAINEVARGFGKRTVAEYVEDAETLAMLRAYGVDYAQGYYVGRPQPASEILHRQTAAPGSAASR